MSDVQQSIILTLLVPILEAWANKDQRAAAHDAGRLTFFRDGMLERLQAIANRKATERTFGALKRDYEQSRSGVEKSLARLTEARDKLAGTPIGRQIDAILYSENAGKTTIRWEIEHLLHSWECAKDLPASDPLLELSIRSIKEDAAHICRGIEVFNAEVERLSRMVRNA